VLNVVTADSTHNKIDQSQESPTQKKSQKPTAKQAPKKQQDSQTKQVQKQKGQSRLIGIYSQSPTNQKLNSSQKLKGLIQKQPVQKPAKEPLQLSKPDKFDRPLTAQTTPVVQQKNKLITRNFDSMGSVLN
jgi:hypothetical protein